MPLSISTIMSYKFISVGFVTTRAAHETFTEFEIAMCLNRHFCGDWGDLTIRDKKSNEDALKSGDRILSAYNIRNERMWIITDAANDFGVREYTTVLLPSDY